jgi:hypothetical protein
MTMMLAAAFVMRLAMAGDISEIRIIGGCERIRL